MGDAFDHECLEVYRTALSFCEMLASMSPRRGHHALHDQINRSSAGVVLCIAEGAGRRGANDKRHFYAMARGSATESAAALDLLLARRLINPSLHQQARAKLLSIMHMLSRLSAKPEPEPEPEPGP